MKYIKLFENWEVEIDEVDKTIKDIIIDLTDKSQYELRFISQFQKERNRIVMYLSTSATGIVDYFSMKDIQSEVFQIINYMKSIGFPLKTLQCLINKVWYNCEIDNGIIKGIDRNESSSWLFIIEDMTSFELIFQL